MVRKTYHLALFFISSATLSFEISLMRMLRVEGFGNFTYGAIALALTGFGASGTILSLVRNRIKGREHVVSFWSPVLFCFFLGLGFWGSTHIDFDALRILWDRNQLFRLFFRYLLYTIPFITGSTFIVLSFFIGSPGRVYAFNLTGSGFGIVTILIGLHFLSPARILVIPMFLALLSVLFSMFAFRHMTLLRFLCIPVIACGILFLSMGDIRILPFKGREIALNLPDSQIVASRHSPHGTVEVIASRKIRLAPGLSLSFDGVLPRQHALYIDGDLLSAIDNAVHPSSLDYLFYTTPQAVYELHKNPAVFIAGLGGGTSVARSIRNNAAAVLAVEENPSVSKLLKGQFNEFTGGLFNRPEVTITSKAVRSVLAHTASRWDIIEVPENVFASSIGGIYSTDADFRLTVEAFHAYMETLDDGGTLSATVSLKQPPRNLPKLAGAVARALLKQGSLPSQCMVVIRSWSTGTVLAKKTPFTMHELHRIREFCERMGFDLVYYPGITTLETNRFNIVEDNIYHRTTLPVIMGERGFIRQYLFNIAPATDDRPYFSYFFRIGKLHHLFGETGRRWLFVVEGGYIVLFATFAATLIIAALFILIPPLCLRWKVRNLAAEVLVYFSLIALAFMFIEILLIQKFHRFISNPLYSSSLVIATLLICTGIASNLSDRVANRQRALIVVVSTLSVYLAVLLLLIERLFPLLMTGPEYLEFVIPILTTAPLGMLMGFFFPLGMSSIKERHPETLPWAWSINGFFSVIASSGTLLLISNAGMMATAVLAVICYLIAVLFFPRADVGFNQ
jgi:hypothetical protein